MSQPVPPPPPSPSGGQDVVAGVGIRFGARLIDGLLFGILIGAVIGVLVAIGLVGEADATSWIYQSLPTLLYIAYFVGFESSRGQTVGKMLLKLEVQGPNGGHPTPEQALKRNGWLALGLLPVIGGIAGLVAAIAIAVTISSSDTNQGWHDNVGGGTRVLRAG